MTCLIDRVARSCRAAAVTLRFPDARVSSTSPGRHDSSLYHRVEQVHRYETTWPREAVGKGLNPIGYCVLRKVPLLAADCRLASRVSEEIGATFNSEVLRADEGDRAASSHMRKSADPATRFALVGGEQANRLATAAPRAIIVRGTSGYSLFMHGPRKFLGACASIRICRGPASTTGLDPANTPRFSTFHERGNANGYLDMCLTCLIAPMRKALRWCAFFPLAARLYELLNYERINTPPTTQRLRSSPTGGTERWVQDAGTGVTALHACMHAHPPFTLRFSERPTSAAESRLSDLQRVLYLGAEQRVSHGRRNSLGLNQRPHECEKHAKRRGKKRTLLQERKEITSSSVFIRGDFNDCIAPAQIEEEHSTLARAGDEHLYAKTRLGKVKETAGIAERRMEGVRVYETELVASSSHQTALGRARSAARLWFCEVHLYALQDVLRELGKGNSVQYFVFAVERRNRLALVCYFAVVLMAGEESCQRGAEADGQATSEVRHHQRVTIGRVQDLLLAGIRARKIISNVTIATAVYPRYNPLANFMYWDTLNRYRIISRDLT
ncbi:hypothetical protein PR048_029053 [Dryococelus australis]|uniref:Uncharacterized protein n=1 Tax=Dryococelus australis TaxID=614101 RepID=A0ABQ9GEX7_9NEOP|nr:hypothetical protein PR048_029053 [Dryococelus australis]